MSVCGSLTQSFGFNCTSPLAGGTADRAYIIDYEKYRAATIDTNATNFMVKEGITLAGTDAFFTVDGKNNSNAPSFNLVKQAYADVYDHLFNFLCFDLSNEAKKALNDMVGGRYVVIFENNYRGNSAEATFEILGSNAGLEFKTFTRDPLNNDNQGAYVITMGTPDVGKEPHAPYSLFDTDYATTKALLEGLI